MSRKFVFDEASVEALAPGEKEWRAWDEMLEGFGVSVRPSRTKSWIVSVKERDSDGKARARRITIGRHGEMSLEDARTKARRILDDPSGGDDRDAATKLPSAEGGEGAASQDRGSDEPAAEAGGEPDAAAGPAGRGVPAEEASGSRADVGPAGEEYDPETGEILRARENSVDDPDEDLGEHRFPPEASPGPEETAPGPGYDENFMGKVIGAVVDGAARGKEYEIVAEAERKAAAAPVRESEVPAEAGAEREADGPGERPGGNGAEGGTGETEGSAPGPGRAGRARAAVAGAAGKVMGWRRTMKTPDREGRAEDEEETAAQDEPRKGSSPGVESGEAGEGGPEPSGEPKLDAKKQTHAVAEEEQGDGERLSEESVAGLAKNLDGIRGVVDRLEVWSEKVGTQMELMSGSAAVLAVDGRQKRRSVARAVLTVMVAVAVGCAGGAAIQSQFPLLPRADPSLGWRDHIWNHYGSAFTACYDRARKDASGRVKCEIEVRGR